MAYSDRLTEAFRYAAELHRRQVRKGTQIPYITDLMAVAVIVAEYGGDENQMIAALLHDGPEDQGGRPTLDAMRCVFGDDVAEIVEACTDTFDSPKPPWKGPKEKYLAHLREVPERALLVSAADKLHNVRAIIMGLRREGLACFDKFKGGREGTLWYYTELVKVYKLRGPVDLARELERLVEEMRRLAIR